MKATLLMASALLLMGQAPRVQEKAMNHVVKKNETLMTISNVYYGTHQCWKIIAELNRGLLISHDGIEVGSTLQIPPHKNCRHPRAAVVPAPAITMPTPKAVPVVERNVKSFKPVWKPGQMLEDVGARRQVVGEPTAELIEVTPAAAPKKSVPVTRQGDMLLWQKENSKKLYFVQLKSLDDKLQAKAACQTLKQQLGERFECHLDLFTDKNKKLFWRVQWGPFDQRRRALEALTVARQQGKITDAFILHQ